MGQVGVLLDEMLGSKKLAAFLEQLGCSNVTSVYDEGLAGCPDDQHLVDRATELGMVFLTHDKEVANTRKYPPCQHSGIIRVASKRGPKELRDRLKRFVAGGHPPRCLHAIVILEKSRFRVIGPEGWEILSY